MNCKSAGLDCALYSDIEIVHIAEFGRTGEQKTACTVY